MDAQPAALGLNGEDFPGYFGRNLVLYLVWIVLWGVPVIAGLGDHSRDGLPPLVAGVLHLLVGFSFVGFLVVPQVFVLLAYLAIVWRSRRRRLVAILLSPLAVGTLILGVDSLVHAAAVLVAGATYGASLWFPAGTWWQRRPIVLAAAGTWVALLAAIGVVQPLSAGIRTDVTVTVRDGDRTGRYRLRCEYDRAGRIRRAVDGPDAHPGGIRVCEILDRVVTDDAPRDERLQEGCPLGRRRGDLSGKVRGEPFRAYVFAVACEADSFGNGEANLVVPPVPD